MPPIEANAQASCTRFPPAPTPTSPTSPPSLHPLDLSIPLILTDQANSALRDFRQPSHLRDPGLLGRRAGTSIGNGRQPIDLTL